MNIRVLHKFVICFYLVTVVISCSNAANQSLDKSVSSKQIVGTSQNNNLPDSIPDLSDQPPEFTELYYPLTLQKLQSIRNSSSTCNFIEIGYTTDEEPDQNGRYMQDYRMFLRFGNTSNVFTYDSGSIFNGSYIHRDRTIPLLTDYFHEFSSSEINTIFNYLESHSDYFFNHEEFNGQNEYLASFDVMCHGHYMFWLAIGDPLFFDPSWQEQYRPAWAISKCVDEYPGGPDDPLYGLFQMLENDFITQFE